MADLLDSIPIDACPACGTVLQESRCRGCGFVRPRYAGQPAATGCRVSAAKRKQPEHTRRLTTRRTHLVSRR